MAAGNRHLQYKDLLNSLEERSPGAKASFYAGFVERMLPLLASFERRSEVRRCVRCDAPTGGESEVCAFCRLVERTGGHEPVPVEMLLSKKARRRASQQGE